MTRVILRLGHEHDLRVVLGLSLGIGRLLILQILLSPRLLENLQPRECQERGGIADLVQAVFRGLLRDHFAANQVIEQLRALLGRDLGRRLARGVLDIEVEHPARDLHAVHGGDGLLFGLGRLRRRGR